MTKPTMSSISARADAIRDKLGCSMRTALWWALRRADEDRSLIEVTIRPPRPCIVPRRLVGKRET